MIRRARLTTKRDAGVYMLMVILGAGASHDSATMADVRIQVQRCST
jgi:hypothetical protein